MIKTILIFISEDTEKKQKKYKIEVTQMLSLFSVVYFFVPYRGLFVCRGDQKQNDLKKCSWSKLIRTLLLHTGII